jgi:Skp1 family, dimerisation domain
MCCSLDEYVHMINSIQLSFKYKMLTIICKDNKEISLPSDIIKKSEILLFMAAKSNNKPLIFNTLEHESLVHCIKAMKLINADPPIIQRPLKSNYLTDYLSGDLITYLSQVKDTIFEMTDAAQVLSLDSLFDVCCLYIAFECKHLTTLEFRNKYNIINDFNKDEEQKVVRFFSKLVEIF